MLSKIIRKLPYFLLTIAPNLPKLTLADRLLLISFDGFRWDYLKTYAKQTRNIQQLAKKGVQAEYLTNQFITKTFPNHFSIVTGLYEESHGLISNHFYDPVLKKPCSYCNKEEFFTEEPYQTVVEPIWKTLESQTLKKAAVYYWPGSDIPGLTPYYYVSPYDASVSFKTRADQVIKWLRDDDISLIALYSHEPDRQGHKHGPNSNEVREAILKVDDLLGFLLQEVHSNPSDYDDLNIVLTSDHGMTELYHDKQVVLADYLTEDVVAYLDESDHFVDYQSGAHIWCEDEEKEKEEETPSKNNCDQIYSTLNPIFNDLGFIKIYKKSEIPEKFHYKNSPRIPPLLISCDLPYQVHLKINDNSMRGTHGYENTPQNVDMHPIFIAAGKKIKSNTENPNTPLTIPPFNNIHLYSLFCEILDIQPNKFNNGSVEAIQHILKDDGIEWYTLGRIVLDGDWTLQKIIGASCMITGILVGLYAVIFLKDDEENGNGDGNEMESSGKYTKVNMSDMSQSEENDFERQPMMFSNQGFSNSDNL